MNVTGLLVLRPAFGGAGHQVWLALANCLEPLLI